MPCKMSRALLGGLLAGALAVLGAGSASAATGEAAPVGAGYASPALGIRHVFVIVLENENYAATYQTNKNPYLGRILPRQGTLLSSYYGTGHESNDNYLAMVSGQAPNPQSQSDCQDYVDFQPSPAAFGPQGQAVGHGCVFPPNVLTLADQVQQAGLSWHGYMQSMGNDLNRDPDRCGAPTSSFGTGMQDGTQKATATDQYAARHNPFVYFHSLIDSGSCERNVLPLPHLSADLANAATTPNLSFIVPDLCNDGHDVPCVGKDVAGSNAGGLTSIDHFLALWVPRIQASAAYRAGGLIVITTDEAASSDASACCRETAGPLSPLPGITGMGGGRVGTLVLGRCVRLGAVDPVPYNHYSLLRSLEDLYGVRTGGSDGIGHLGFAGAAGLAAFGPDVFAACPTAAHGAAPPAAAPLAPTSGVLPRTGGLPLSRTAIVVLACAAAAAVGRRHLGRL
ncbi:MAG: hypothetical protein NVSMB55_26410 [Mycobacteriales bacterium]